MRTYTQEEKQAVIDRVISGEPSAHILADTGIPKSTLQEAAIQDSRTEGRGICLEGRGFIRHVQID